MLLRRETMCVASMSPCFTGATCSASCRKKKSACPSSDTNGRRAPSCTSAGKSRPAIRSMFSFATSLRAIRAKRKPSSRASMLPGWYASGPIRFSVAVVVRKSSSWAISTIHPSTGAFGRYLWRDKYLPAAR